MSSQALQPTKYVTPVQAELLGQGDEVVDRSGRGSRRMTRVTGRALSSSTSLDDHLPGQVTRRGMLAQPVAAPDLLDRDQRRRARTPPPARSPPAGRTSSPGRSAAADSDTITAPLEQTVGPGGSPSCVDQVAGAVPGTAGGQHHRDTGGDHARTARRPSAGSTPSRSTTVPSTSSATSRGRQPVARDGWGVVIATSALAPGTSASRPPRNGRSAAGTRTEPSACWWFSSIMTIIRVIAHSVPFSVATGADAVVEPAADVQPAGLELGAVRGRGDLAVALLASAASRRSRTCGPR